MPWNRLLTNCPKRNKNNVPKATLTFNLPEEQSEFNLTQKAGALSLIIYDFTQKLRAHRKYTPDEKIDWEQAWWDLMKEHGYDPYEE
jgi:hypothetical protein